MNPFGPSLNSLKHCFNKFYLEASLQKHPHLKHCSQIHTVHYINLDSWLMEVYNQKVALLPAFFKAFISCPIFF